MRSMQSWKAAQHLLKDRRKPRKTCGVPVHQLAGLYNRDGECLLRGTDWILKHKSVLSSSLSRLACVLPWEQTVTPWSAGNISVTAVVRKVYALLCRRSSTILNYIQNVSKCATTDVEKLWRRRYCHCHTFALAMTRFVPVSWTSNWETNHKNAEGCTKRHQNREVFRTIEVINCSLQRIRVTQHNTTQHIDVIQLAHGPILLPNTRLNSKLANSVCPNRRKLEHNETDKGRNYRRNHTRCYKKKVWGGCR